MITLAEWLPTIVSAGALAFLWWMIKRSLNQIEQKLKEKSIEMETEIKYIKENYVAKETHALICGLSKAEIEKLFTKCLEKFKNDFFAKIRDIENQINDLEKKKGVMKNV